MCTWKCVSLTLHTLSPWKIQGKFELVGAIKKKRKHFLALYGFILNLYLTESIKKRLWAYCETVLHIS